MISTSQGLNWMPVSVWKKTISCQVIGFEPNPLDVRRLRRRTKRVHRYDNTRGNSGNANCASYSAILSGRRARFSKPS